MTKTQAQVVRGTFRFGAEQPKREGRRFLLHAKDFTDTEQGVAVRAIFGRVTVAGVTVTPVWDFKATAVKKSVGKGK